MIAKIVNKILALRLAPFLNELVAPCQSAFIKGRSIHDNFLYVRNIARRFHRNRTPALLLKLDISKAQSQLRWHPRWTLAEALERIVDWHRAWLSGADMHAYCHTELERFAGALPSSSQD